MAAKKKGNYIDILILQGTISPEQLSEAKQMADQAGMKIPDALDRLGYATGEEVARAMAAGALKTAAVQIAVAVTGIAGPGGGSAEKPVGRVHLAATNIDGVTLHRKMDYGDIGRSEVRIETVLTALEILNEISA